MRKLYVILLFFYFLIFPTFVEAQVGTFFTKYEPSRRWSLGVQISPTELEGDADNLQLGMSFGGHLKYSFGQSFAIKINGDIGQLKGGRINQSISRNGSRQYNGVFKRGAINVKDPGNQAPSEDNYTFTNNFKDLNFCTVYTLGNISFLKPLRKYQVFMFVGIGAIWSKAKGDWQDTNDRWNDVAGNRGAPLGEYLRYNGDPRSNGKVRSARNFTVPFGIGVKRNFGKRLDLGIEYRMHYTRSDNLDALSAPTWRNRFTDFYTLLGFQASFKLKTKKENDENHYDWLNPVESLYEKMDSITAVAGALAKDSDNDGVADFLDKDPNTPEGVNVWGNGIAVDSDGDSIIDANDDEPFSSKGAQVDNKGVNINRPVEETTIIHDGPSCCDCNDVVFPPIVFDAGSSKIRPEFYGILHEIATKMKECPDLKIRTIGYPDGSVGAKSGEQLSRIRVNSVVDYLNDYYGIQRNRISVDYKTTEDKDSRYQKNRKVEIKKGN